MTPAGFSQHVIPSPIGLAAASAALSAWLTTRGAPEAAIGRVELVLEEVVMNVLMHGTPAAGPPRIHLAADALASACRLSIRDNGPPFDPATATPRAVGAALDQATPGGLGLVLLRRYAQDLRYQRLPDGNRLDLAIPY